MILIKQEKYLMSNSLAKHDLLEIRQYAIRLFQDRTLQFPGKTLLH